MFDYYSELRHISEQINALQISDAEHKSMQQKLINAVETIAKLSNIATKEGLLALEEAGIKLNNSHPMGKELSKMVTLVVDGTEPVLVEELLINKYIMHGYTDYNALTALIYIKGITSIQAGENLIITNERLLAMLPVSITEQAWQCLDDLRHTFTDMPDADPREVFCEAKNIKLSPDEDEYFAAKLLDYAFSRWDDRCIQRILRDVENRDLARLIAISSGKTNQRIFDNLSERLGKMIAEDAIYLNNLSITKNGDAAYRILCTCIKLLNVGEIAARGIDGAELEIFTKMHELFLADFEKRKQIKEENRQQKNELAELFREYNQRK